MMKFLYLILIWLILLLATVIEMYAYGYAIGRILIKHGILYTEDGDKYLLFSFEALWKSYSFLDVLPRFLRFILIPVFYALTSPFIDIPVLLRINSALSAVENYKEKLKDLKNRVEKVEEDMKNG